MLLFLLISSVATYSGPVLRRRRQAGRQEETSYGHLDPTTEPRGPARTRRPARSRALAAGWLLAGHPPGGGRPGLGRVLGNHALSFGRRPGDKPRLPVLLP